MVEAAETAVAKAMYKGGTFKERMLRSQLWQITSALSDALREVLGDKEVKNKLKAVRAVLDEFVEWLEGQVGEVVAKEEVAEVVVKDEVDTDAGALDAIQDVQDETLKAVEKQSRVLAAIGKRLVALEKQHPGRRSELGGQDVDEEVAKANQNGQKGYRGLQIDL